MTKHIKGEVRRIVVVVSAIEEDIEVVASKVVSNR